MLALIGFITNRFTSDIREEQMRYVNEASEVVIYTGQMERNLFQSLNFLNGIREGLEANVENTTFQELPAVSEQTKNFQQELVHFEESFAALKALLNENEELPEDLTELLKSYQVYKSISREWLQLGTENFEQANVMFINSIEPYFRNNIIPEITDLRSYVLNIQDRRNRSLENSLDRAALANFLATLFSVLFAIALAVYIYRSIANPLSKLSLAAKKLGQGNLNERIEYRSKDEIGELADAFNSMAEGLQNKTVSITYVDNIIESIHEALFVTDNDGILKRVNSAAARLTGYLPEEMIGKPAKKFYELDKRNKPDDEEAEESGTSYEYALKKKDNTSIPVLFSEARLRDSQGEMVGMVSVASDISERIEREKEIRESLKEKEVMLAEIHHRVKNNLAVVSGLLQLQSFNAEDKEVLKALTDSQTRIQSIALVHEMLYESESLAYIKYNKYVNDLLQAIQSMHLNSSNNIDLVADVDPISLSINQAIPCSLLINELVVNAFKHAFDEGKEGKIFIDVKKKENKIRVAIRDNGIGIDSTRFEEATSLGATLIKTLSRQLKAKFQVIDRKENQGSEFFIEFVHDQ
ncbi:sensor histidine kinase [Gracilimonas mengyeensis]|uniref:histidine kinase n=1 Tax=Gracilimonas mengyeensis TaxID=1302730 RepID=A0A521B4I4_9BACT|nr:histidine kinase dimerization/phosphoacceptor domain -containing protein [Gracilimonas mengyeensis]SMO42002.1 PAS domain S-box-containing protein [Gracilimonas mengyeensis]